MRKLSNNAIVFENCISNSTWTLPSHISMFTGVYESQNYQLSQDIYKLSKKIPVLAEILKDMGYFNLCYSENPWINKQTGLTRGFDILFNKWMDTFKPFFIDKLDFLVKRRIKAHIPINYWQIFKNFIEKINLSLSWKKVIFGHNRDSVGQFEEFSQKISLNTEKSPLFLFINIMANHAPYYSTDKILRSFNITLEDFKIIKLLFLHNLRYFLDININANFISEEKAAILKKFYEASVNYSDLVVKKILIKLENLGILENSYVIITSDHGELLGGKLNHYYYTHGVFQSVHDALIKVPLIIYNPNFEKKIIKDLVELKDLFHTVLHLTGISGNKNKYFNEEKSILNQINNNSTPKYVLGEFIKNKKEMLDRINFHRRTIEKSLIPRLFHDIYFMRSNKYKFIRYHSGLEEFYDILKDPNELNNIIDIGNESYKEMKLKVEEFIKNKSNMDELKMLITEKEKNSIKNVIDNIKIKGI